MSSASDVVIREVTTDVWTFSRPLSLFNRIPVGGRSTAIKLQDGSVWILASTPLTADTGRKLGELGEVKYIVAGNAFHHMFLKGYKDAYPDAKVIGPEEVNAKKVSEGWQLHATFSAAQPDLKHGFEDEIEHCFFSAQKNKDTAFYHKASKTVIAADLLFNLPPTEQYALSQTSPNFPILSGFKPNSWIMRAFVWSQERNRATMQQDVHKVASWDFERFIPCHGNVIETNAKQAWKDAYQRYF